MTSQNSSMYIISAARIDGSPVAVAMVPAQLTEDLAHAQRLANSYRRAGWNSVNLSRTGNPDKIESAEYQIDSVDDRQDDIAAMIHDCY